MGKDSKKQKSSNKTIRMNKKQFFILAFLAPMFASYFAVFSFLSIYQAINKDDASLEVPVLGGIVEESTKTTPESEKSDESEESKESEAPEEVITIVSPDVSPEAANKSIKQSQTAAPVKSQTYQTKSTTKTSTKETTSNTSTPAQPTTPSAKELCEARTDGPTTFVKVSLMKLYQIMRAEDLGYENPVVDYTKYVVSGGKNAKMVYKNNACIPSEDNLEIVEDTYLSEADLEKYGIEKKTYSFWL